MVALTTIASCYFSDTRYNRFREIENSLWDSRRPVVFMHLPFDSVCSTSSELNLSLRHNNSYPYRNIWLFINYIDHNDNVYNDTIELQLADIYGKWNGSGFGSTYEYTTRLEPPIDLRHIATIKFYHGMRSDTIAGISNLGITLVK